MDTNGCWYVCNVAVLAEGPDPTLSPISRAHNDACGKGEVFFSALPVAQHSSAPFRSHFQVADPATLSKLIFIALHHDTRITHVETMRAYYGGAKLLVEV